MGLLRTLPILLALLVPSGACPGLANPVAGELVREFAPVGAYGGHWGVDLEAAEGTAVFPADGGVVTFAGPVAEVLSVTVAHGGGLRTSYSYLSSVYVAEGQLVERSDSLGTTGLDHGVAALHFSVRIGDRYQDPDGWLDCFSSPHRGLSLVPNTGDP